jgi:hypothetical protein
MLLSMSMSYCSILLLLHRFKTQLAAKERCRVMPQQRMHLWNAILLTDVNSAPDIQFAAAIPLPFCRLNEVINLPVHQNVS